ncbi:hypothetical protein GUITHDRAFT_98936 [Guillardia theta CCMP2712]|uniref:Uncharacterized protein n=1 Tax=Guillardia theta (strain CCMP2712) TaxID=905079 RepID=L1K3H0_GUITC|nr:hypothetical protein GUITHDRAFT_98936 [Guillardia theta CCMP2712]EKX55154.1 hypothetical protein GUITHDRAFT_98936 [Guillardia theta CCMP2712]|eukprot:XP_005842134.1 hypothetical protein GUITHDRAFT_98936 [Guillardia theta CCMP2712]
MNSDKTRIAGSGSESTAWTSETAVSCQQAAGEGRSMRVGVTAGGGGSGGTGTEAISADGAGASGVREGGNRAGTGSTGVTVYGAGLGRYEGQQERGGACGQIVLTITSLVGTGSDLVSYDRVDVSGAVVSNQPSAYVTVRLLGKGYGMAVGVEPDVSCERAWDSVPDREGTVRVNSRREHIMDVGECGSLQAVGRIRRKQIAGVDRGAVFRDVITAREARRVRMYKH